LEELAMRTKLSMVGLLAFSVLIAPLQAIAQTQQQPTPPQNYYGPGPWHMWGYGYGGGWPFWGMFPMMLLFLVLCAVVIFFFARGCMGARHHWSPMSQDWGDPTHSALQILNERFAKGEIQRPEYDEKKAAIVSGARR
jgi:putative membrane protein